MLYIQKVLNVEKLAAVQVYANIRIDFMYWKESLKKCFFVQLGLWEVIQSEVQ